MDVSKRMMAISRGDMEMAQKPESMLLAKKLFTELNIPKNPTWMNSSFHSRKELSFVSDMYNMIGPKSILNYGNPTESKSNPNELASNTKVSNQVQKVNSQPKNVNTNEFKTVPKPIKFVPAEDNYKNIPSTSKATDADLIAMSKQQSTFEESKIPDATGQVDKAGFGFEGGATSSVENTTANTAIDMAKLGTDLIEPTKAIGDAVSMSVPLLEGAINSSKIGAENQGHGVGNEQQMKADSANASSEQSGAMAGMMLGGMFGPIGQVAGTVAGSLLAPKVQPVVNSSGGANETNSNVANFGQ